MRLKYFALGIIALLVACTQPQVPADYTDAGKPAPIYPDYIGVTIPINMAPLHFQLMQPADEVVCRFTVGNEQLVCEGPKVMPSIDERHLRGAHHQPALLGKLRRARHLRQYSL